VAGYLAIWLVFSVGAALLQSGFERLAWVSSDMMSAQSIRFVGLTFLLAGVYQLSPVQNVCLRHCRSPAAFLNEHYRPGATGALRLGLVHGAYCVACCWLLMALLFVGGVMNLVWIAALTLLVVAEKTLPGGRTIGSAAGIALAAAGALFLLGRFG
jgi:predicted metal-binding membrane protein